MAPIETSIHQRLEHILREQFSPTYLDIQDDSHKHAGHGGSREGGETHFRVTLSAEAFIGQPRVSRQRAVMAAVKPLMDERIHALQLFTYTPEEFAARS